MKKRNSKSALQGIRIVYEDQDVIVIQKDAGVLSQALKRADVYSVEGALTEYLRKGQWKSSKRAYLVHRLDRDTSGLMMVAKSEKVQTWFRDNWNELTEKSYLAVVEGDLPAEEGVLESYLREDENQFVKSVKNPKFGKYACTEWKVLERMTGKNGAAQTLVEAKLKTGRKNQIRVQFAEFGHPVVGDRKYGNGKAGDALMLHARKLSFKHPFSARVLTFESSPDLCLGGFAQLIMQHTEK